MNSQKKMQKKQCGDKEKRRNDKRKQKKLNERCKLKKMKHFKLIQYLSSYLSLIDTFSPLISKTKL